MSIAAHGLCRSGSVRWHASMVRGPNQTDAVPPLWPGVGLPPRVQSLAALASQSLTAAGRVLVQSSARVAHLSLGRWYGGFRSAAPLHAGSVPGQAR